MWMDVVTALWANAVGVCGGLDGSCCNPLQMQRCMMTISSDMARRAFEAAWQSHRVFPIRPPVRCVAVHCDPWGFSPTPRWRTAVYHDRV